MKIAKGTIEIIARMRLELRVCKNKSVSSRNQNKMNGRKNMALRNVVQDGDPVLKKKCRPVTEFNERLAILLDDMAETMMEENGLGLAGPQVGVMRRIFVALDESDIPEHLKEESLAGDDADEMQDDDAGSAFILDDSRDEDENEEEWAPTVVEFINPEILETEGNVRGYEGCLSFPGKLAAIARPHKVKVRAFDRDGNPFEYEATGILARCLCHETDHLNGVTIDDLAEYFYDPNTPHDLDELLVGAAVDENDNAELGEAEKAKDNTEEKAE